MNKQLTNKNTNNDNIFFIASALLLLALPSSEWLITAASGLLFLQIFMTRNYRRLAGKLADYRVWMYPAVFFVYVFFLVLCEDPTVGYYELKKNAFWLFIPLSVALSPRLKPLKVRWLLMIFVIAVTIITAVTFVKIVFSDYFQIMDVRFASYVSHFTFSLLVIFALYLLLIGKIEKWLVFRKLPVWALLLWCTWLFGFLGVQKSLIGIISLLGSVLVFLLWMGKHVYQGKLMHYFKMGALAFVLFPIIYLSVVLVKFYNVPKYTGQETKFTQQGNPYTFNLNNKQKENGKYVYWYLSDKEMVQAWKERSTVDLEMRDRGGNRIHSTLIRYLTSLGLRKDAAGVAALSASDIKNIEEGIANPIYVQNNFGIYPKVYQTIWELDEYARTGNPDNKSLSQRIEYMKAALYLIKNNFWGIGTGNYKKEFNSAYEELDTKMNKQFWFHVHNQYLSYLVKFGWLGFLLIMFFILYPVIKLKGFRNISLIMLFIIVGLANMGEALIETHVGLPFFTFFTALFLWHSPKQEASIDQE